MSSSRKKIILRKLSTDWIGGYLPANGFAHSNAVEMLGLDGKIVSLSVQELKWICFVRDFNSGEPRDPERLLRKNFVGRPRGEGIFVRLRFTDGDQLEGLAENNLSLLDAEGFFLIPPDTRSNTQRIWIPRPALAGFEVAAVIGVTKKKPENQPKAVAQDSLFPSE